MIRTTITDSETGSPFAEALIPEGWKASFNLREDIYAGSLNPIYFSFTAASPDGLDFMRAVSAGNYVELMDETQTRKDMTFIEDSEEIYRKFRTCEQYIKEVMRDNVGEGGSFALSAQRYPTTEDLDYIEHCRLERAEEYAVKSKNNGEIGVKLTPGEYYYSPLLQVFDGISRGNKYTYAVNCCLEACEVTVEETSPEGKLKKRREKPWSAYWVFILRSTPERFEQNYSAFLSFMESYEYKELLEEKIKTGLDKVAAKRERRLEKKNKAADAPCRKLFSSKDGKPLLEGIIPRNWRAEGRLIDSYFGYGYPYGYSATASDEKNTAYIKYLNPINYIQDSRYPNMQLKISEYNALLRDFMSLEDFLDNCAKEALGKYEGFSFVKQLPPVFAPDANYEELQKKKYAQRKTQLAQKEPDSVLNGYYYKAASRIYSYKYKGFERLRVYTAMITGEDTTEYFEVAIPDTMKNDPYWMSLCKSTYNGFFKDEKGRYMYLFRRANAWFVSNRSELDCPKERLEELYPQIYKNFVSSITLRPELKEILKKKTEEKDEEAAAVRADKAEAERILRQTQEQSRKAALQTADYVRRRNSEIGDIINSTYENSSRTYERANRRWSDSFMGYSRYSDRYGYSYKVENHGKYAFRRGDTVITTDDPRSPGANWEQLQKDDY